MATKTMNLGNASNTVNLVANGNVVGSNIKSKGSNTKPVYFDENGIAQQISYDIENIEQRVSTIESSDDGASSDIIIVDDADSITEETKLFIDTNADNVDIPTMDDFDILASRVDALENDDNVPVISIEWLKDNNNSVSELMTNWIVIDFTKLTTTQEIPTGIYGTKNKDTTVLFKFLVQIDEEGPITSQFMISYGRFIKISHSASANGFTYVVDINGERYYQYVNTTANTVNFRHDSYIGLVQQEENVVKFYHHTGDISPVSSIEVPSTATYNALVTRVTNLENDNEGSIVRVVDLQSQNIYVYEIIEDSNYTDGLYYFINGSVIFHYKDILMYEYDKPYTGFMQFSDNKTSVIVLNGGSFKDYNNRMFNTWNDIDRRISILGTYLVNLIDEKADINHKHKKADITDFPTIPDAYDDTALSGRVSAIEGKEAGWDAKSAPGHTHTKSEITDFPTIPSAYDDTALKNRVSALETALSGVDAMADSIITKGGTI